MVTVGPCTVVVVVVVVFELGPAGESPEGMEGNASVLELLLLPTLLRWDLGRNDMMKDVFCPTFAGRLRCGTFPWAQEK